MNGNLPFCFTLTLNDTVGPLLISLRLCLSLSRSLLSVSLFAFPPLLSIVPAGAIALIHEVGVLLHVEQEEYFLWNIISSEDSSFQQVFFSPILSDKPVIGDEFLVKFLQNYEMEEDVRMLLEMPANGEKELAGRNDVSQATSPGLSVFMRGFEDMRCKSQDVITGFLYLLRTYFRLLDALNWIAHTYSPSFTYIFLHAQILISNIPESGKTDTCHFPSGLVFFEGSNLKLDDQEGEKISLVSERDQGRMCESRAEKILRKTHHHARKEVQPMAICV